jgi:hypothetical protein
MPAIALAKAGFKPSCSFLCVNKKCKSQPPYTITPIILRLVTEIDEAIDRLSAQADTIRVRVHAPLRRR